MSVTILLLVLAVIGTATSLTLFTLAASAERRPKHPVSTTVLATAQSKAADLKPLQGEHSQLLSLFQQQPTRPAIAMSFAPPNPRVAVASTFGRVSLQGVQTAERGPLSLFTDEPIILQLTPTQAGRS